MSRIIVKTLLMRLAWIETIHKELQGRFQCFWAVRKTARAAHQASQIVAQFGVIGFDRVGAGFALRDFIHTPVIPQAIIGVKGFAIIALALRRFIHQLRDDCLCSLPNDLKAQIAAGKPIYEDDDEDLVLLSLIKVNNSSISASLTSLGTGGSGNLSAWAWTDRETVRW
jgi:hypothetical protein